MADIRVGQNFIGSTYSYFPSGFRLFDLALGDLVTPVEGRAGDVPAAQVAPLGEGLNILIHETKDLTLRYSEWEKFVGFVEHKDFKGALEAHKARGLPETGFVEAYSRYAKALIGVGAGDGADRAFGLETEFVALSNPYTEALSDGFEALLLYQGAPRGNVQVELFDSVAGEKPVQRFFRTDAAGHVRVPVEPGHMYMLDAVVLREPDPDLAEARGAVWESLWANLTFAVPGGADQDP